MKQIFYEFSMENAMNIKNLTDIGHILFSELGRTRLMPFESESLGKGAAGDNTFPMPVRRVAR